MIGEAGSLTIRKLLTQWGFNVDSGKLIQLDAAIDKVKAKAKSAQQIFNNWGNSLSSLGSQLTNFVTLPLIGSMTAIIAIGKRQEEFRDKTDAVFGDSAKSVRNWSEKNSVSLVTQKGIIADLLSQIYTFGEGLGLTGKKGIEFSENLAKVAILQARLKGTDPSDMFNRMRRALVTGNPRMLLMQGLVTKAALEQAKYNKNLDDGAKKTALYNAILLSTGKAERYNILWQAGLTGSIEKTTLAVKKFSGDVVKIMIPVLLRVAKIFVSLVDKWSALSDKQRKSIIHWVLLAAAIGPFLTILGKIYLAIAWVIRITIALKGMAIAFMGVGSSAAFADLMMGLMPILIMALIAVITVLIYQLYKYRAELKETTVAIKTALLGWLNYFVGYIRLLSMLLKTSESRFWDRVRANILLIKKTLSLSFPIFSEFFKSISKVLDYFLGDSSKKITEFINGFGKIGPKIKKALHEWLIDLIESSPLYRLFDAIAKKLGIDISEEMEKAKKLLAFIAAPPILKPFLLGKDIYESGKREAGNVADDIGDKINEYIDGMTNRLNDKLDKLEIPGMGEGGGAEKSKFNYEDFIKPKTSLLDQYLKKQIEAPAYGKNIPVESPIPSALQKNVTVNVTANMNNVWNGDSSSPSLMNSSFQQKLDDFRKNLVQEIMREVR